MAAKTGLFHRLLMSARTRPVRLSFHHGAVSARSFSTNGFACAVPPDRVGPQETVRNHRIQEYQT
jgi:hypothetical protein